MVVSRCYLDPPCVRPRHLQGGASGIDECVVNRVLMLKDGCGRKAEKMPPVSALTLSLFEAVVFLSNLKGSVLTHVPLVVSPVFNSFTEFWQHASPIFYAAVDSKAYIGRTQLRSRNS